MKLAEVSGVLLTPLKWRFHCKSNADCWPSSGDLFMQGSTDQTLMGGTKVKLLQREHKERLPMP